MDENQRIKKIWDQIQAGIIGLVLDDKKLNFSANLEATTKSQLESLGAVLADAVTEIRPSFQIGSGYYRQGRLQRSFEFEFKRIYTFAIARYVDYFINVAPLVSDIVNDAANSKELEDYKSGVNDLLVNHIIPALASQDQAGDDLYIHVQLLMNKLSKLDVVTRVADTKKTPSQIDIGLLSIFGLLEQARSYHAEGEMAAAYSCLLDASHMVGMHDGGAFVTRYLDDISIRMAGQRSAKLGHVANRQLQFRVVDLYFSMMPTGGKSKSRGWGSARQAADAIFTFLEQEAVDAMSSAAGSTVAPGNQEGDEKADPMVFAEPEIKHSTVLKVCRIAHRHEKSGNSLDVKYKVIDALPEEGK